MPKVQCKNCKHWLESHRRHKRNRLTSFSFDYEIVGYCMDDKCAKETSGYTGIGSGHKMTRSGEIERYCKFFEPKERP